MYTPKAYRGFESRLLRKISAEFSISYENSALIVLREIEAAGLKKGASRNHGAFVKKEEKCFGRGVGGSPPKVAENCRSVIFECLDHGTEVAIGQS